MSAHLQFGPEWMRKGAPGGKTPTTPSSESTFSFADQQATKGTNSSSSSSQTRKNLTPSKESGPAPVSPSAAPLPSPGAFSFAAAAAASGGGSNTNSGGVSSNNGNGSFFTIGDGDVSRYSKRLLSLYSTEHGPKGNVSEPPAPTPAPPTGPASSTLPNHRKKGFTDRDTAANGGGPGRRTHSYNPDSNNLAKDRFDGHRPGLFQRGNAQSSNGPHNGASTTNASSGHFTRDRHPSGGGILGGVLAGVTPTSSRKVNSQNEEQNSTQEGDLSTSSSIRTPRRERLPGEGPIGPPTDRNGGFVKGFTTDRRRNPGQVPTPNKPAAPSLSKQDSGKDANLNGPQSTDIDLSHHAATLVESLNLDDDDEEQGQTAAQEQPISEALSWSAENAEWFYRDPSGQVQGPFKANVMQEWYTAKYFQDELLVRPAEAVDFIPLGTMLRLIGDSVNPFLIPPSQYVAAQPPRPQPIQALNIGGQGWSPQGRAQSPFLVNPALSGLAGQANTNSISPFGTPTSPFADLHGGANPSQHQQHLEFMMYQQRILQEQRNAQMAALAMAERSGDPSMMAAAAWNAAPQQQQQPWGQSPQPQYGLAAAPGENTMNDWGSPMRQQQQVYQHQIQQPHQQQPPQQLNDVFSRPDQELHVAQPEDLLTKHEVAEPAETVREHALEPESEQKAEPQAEPVSDPVEEEQKEGKAANLALSDQNTAPEHLWPQSPSAVEFASETAIGEVEPLSLPMTTVKGRKGRRGEGQKQASIEPSTLLENVSSSSPLTSVATAGGLKVMSEFDFRKHQSSMHNQNNRTSVSPELGSKSAIQSASAKAAPWAGNASSNGTSLRDIQEAEEKRAEALKARQQRPIAVRGDSTNLSTPTTMNKMTWGLASVPSSASSNTGSANNVQSPSANANSGPVWNSTTATKTGTPKKTLTEIQEEERKRAAAANSTRSVGPTPAATQGSTKPVLAGRGYADLASANSLPSINTPVHTAANSGASSGASSAGGWAVVGAGGGKPNATSVNPPTAIRTNATPVSSPLTKPLIRSVSTSSGVNSTTTSSGNGAGQIQPSGDFIRYCKEQLKGLQVQVDDFIEMLLSFPLDPSSDVVEIIAESVYANSSTLDGRRFAADFVAKRKQDAINQKRKLPASTFQSSATANLGSDSYSSPLRNASEVLKSQPAVRPVVGNGGSSTTGGGTGDAFGGFKVVKPKGAKKRV